jgi:GDP-L-fucose synthase
MNATLAENARSESRWLKGRQYGRNFVSVMPTSRYGPGDNFDLTGSHVMPVPIGPVSRRAGPGREGRDGVDLHREGPQHPRAGGDGSRRCPSRRAWLFERTKPDGTLLKILDVSRLTALGWRARIELDAGIVITYQWLLEHRDEARLGAGTLATLGPTRACSSNF